MSPVSSLTACYKHEYVPQLVHSFGPLVHSLVHSLVHWSIRFVQSRSFIWSIRPFVGVFVGPFVGPLVHSFCPLTFVHLVHSSIRWSIRWSIGPFVLSDHVRSYTRLAGFTVVHPCYTRGTHVICMVRCRSWRGMKRCRVKAATYELAKGL